MIQVYQIDEEGYIVELFLVPEGTPIFSPYFIAVRCPDGFHVPRWNDETEVWEEGMNIYFEYVTADSVVRADGTVLTTGEIMWAYKGSQHGDWENVDAGCAVIGPFPYATASQIMLDAGADTELYFIQDGVVLIKPNADEILQQRKANRTPTIEEQLAAVTDRSNYLGKTVWELKKQLAIALQSSSTTNT